MAFKKQLSKENNTLYFDFPDAYWRIENIHFTTEGGEFYVQFELKSYPSQDTAWNTQDPQKLAFGDYRHIYNDLYVWRAVIKWSDITTDSVPNNETEQKDILYTHIKNTVSFFSDAVDVLEQ